ncbi:histone deacetylase family protein [Tunicatimonas pelagia]|uniref:histone deacetylase family protein n=1 Tax=Tunicatimonas pelagia TaxID=931531 RepID=UPI002665BAA1|nr:histone deacetylase [Tunicatimonas pelagia]WKN42554.1 histone deacetylase [Tunicatimonas pelagia]
MSEAEPSVFFSDQHLYSLPEQHRFPIDKYILVKEQLLYQGIIREAQLTDPGLCSEGDILRVHTPEYWQAVKTRTLPARMVRRIGLPNTKVSVNRARNSVAGTIAAAEAALQTGIGINLAGGTHHAYADRGEGFSTLNDIAIASRRLLAQQLAERILIIDLDVHQGNGNAVIFQNDPAVFTFSMHGKDNYPLKKEQSDWDIALATGTEDEEYLRLLEDALPKLIEYQQPQIVFYQSGVDVLATDKLGKLALSKAGCRRRDELVFEYCVRHNIPVVTTMGGGYSERMADIVDAHCNTIQAGLAIYAE